MATCTNYFYAEDQGGNALSENVRASIYKFTVDGWTLVGNAWIAPHSGDHLTLTQDNSYKAVPITDISGYTTPDEQIWTACDQDITFVYERICPDPTVSITDVSNYNPESGEVVNFTGYSSGGTGHSIVSRKWDFGDGTSSTLANPSKAWKNTTGSSINYTVRFTATNDCGKSKSTTTTIRVASEAVKTGIEIQIASSLNGKELIAHKAIKVAPGVYWTGPAVALGHDMGRCTWDNINNTKKYSVLVGDACQERPPIDSVYPEYPDLCSGTFDDGDKIIIIARNPGFDWRLYSEDDVVTISESSFNVVSLSTVEDDLVSDVVFNQVCGWFGIPAGSECSAFWAEMYDPVFVANYMSIRATGKDTLGNTRELTWIDDVGFVFALLGMGVPMIPVGKIVSNGLYAVVKISDKVFSPNVAHWTITALFDAPKNLINPVGDKISFSRAIAQVDKTSAEEVIDLLDGGFTGDAHLKLQAFLDAIDPDDLSTMPSGIDWKELNAALKDKIDDPTLYREYIKGFGIADGYASSALVSAGKSAPSPSDVVVISDVVNQPVVMEVIAEKVAGSMKTAADQLPSTEAKKVLEQVENAATNIPKAFTEVAKKPIAEVAESVKHVNCEVLGKKTSVAHKKLITHCFKKRFDNVLPYAITPAECEGITWMVKQDPVAAAKAFDDYTDLADKERLLLSLAKSGEDGSMTAAWLSAAKANSHVDDVYNFYGIGSYKVMNDASQTHMYAPGGVYRNIAIDATDEAASKVPSFTHIKDINKFIQEVSDTVQISSIGDNAAKIAQDAIDDNPQSISQIFQNAGVDVLHANAAGANIWEVSEFIKVLGETVNAGDVTKIMARIVEEDIVANTVVIRNTINRIVGDGYIDDDGLQAIFDIRNQSPEAWKRVMQTIPADVVATLNNVMDSSAKGRAFIQLEDLYTVYRSKMDTAYGATIGEATARFRYMTAPLAMRYNRATGGAGFFNSFQRHGGLKGILRSKYALAYLTISIGTTAGTAVVFWYLFEWSPIRYGLQKAGRLPLPISDWFGDVKNNSTFTTAEFRKTTNSTLYQSLMVNVAGELCEIIDYGNKNPIVNDSKWQELVDGWNFYFGIGQGPTTASMYEDMVDTLETHLRTYNEWIVECVSDGKCVSDTPVCITSDMVWSERSGNTHALASAAAYKTIMDATWVCVPELPDTGTVLCTVSSSMGYGAKVTDGYGVEYGAITDANGFLVTGLALNVEHVLKIVKTGNYTECAETFRLTDADPEQAFQCDINCTDWVDTVTISFVPSTGIQPGTTVQFTGAATSARNITNWLWNFGDPHCPTADNTSTLQNPKHRYEKAGIFPLTLTATNECENEKSESVSVKVGEPVESATIDVKMPIDGSTGDPLIWQTHPFIFITQPPGTEQATGEEAPEPLLFGGFGQPPIRQTVVTIKATGYQDVSKTFNLYDGFSEEWIPEMYPVGYIPPVPKGEITGYLAPSTAKQGDAIVVDATVKNIGAETGEFFCTLFEGETKIGSSLKYTLSQGQSAVMRTGGTMPDHDWNLMVKVFRDGETVEDDVVAFTIKLSAVTFQVNFYLPAGAVLREPVKITKVSRLVTGMRRIGRQ